MKCIHIKGLGGHLIIPLICVNTPPVQNTLAYKYSELFPSQKWKHHFRRKAKQERQLCQVEKQSELYFGTSVLMVKHLAFLGRIFQKDSQTSGK